MRAFSLAALCLSLGVASGLGCAAPGDEDATSQSEDAISAEARNEQVVRAYYAATKSSNPAAQLAPIVADNAILSAPSIKLLKGKSQVEGKKKFIVAVAGGAFLISQATIRDVLSRDGLVVARIELPLPNGDLLTQVEYFTIENGKIARLDSYYDALRFRAALPAIALERLGNALGF
jgi:hypothetical protein